MGVTWSEFQKASQTAAEQGKAELRILDFKTTWSDFQKASQTTAERGKAELETVPKKMSQLLKNGIFYLIFTWKVSKRG